MAACGMKTRRLRRQEVEREAELCACAAASAACGPFFGLLAPDLLLAVLERCDGATLARIEQTCRLFGRKTDAQPPSSGTTLAERAATLCATRCGLGIPSLWALATGASCKHQLARASTPAARIRRFPVAIHLHGRGGVRGPTR